MVALSEKNFLSKMEHSKYDEFNYVPPPNKLHNYRFYKHFTTGIII